MQVHKPSEELYLKEKAYVTLKRQVPPTVLFFGQLYFQGNMEPYAKLRTDSNFVFFYSRAGRCSPFTITYLHHPKSQELF